MVVTVRVITPKTQKYLFYSLLTSKDRQLCLSFCLVGRRISNPALSGVRARRRALQAFFSYAFLSPSTTLWRSQNHFAPAKQGQAIMPVFLLGWAKDKQPALSGVRARRRALHAFFLTRFYPLRRRFGVAKITSPQPKENQLNTMFDWFFVFI